MIDARSDALSAVTMLMHRRYPATNALGTADPPDSGIERTFGGALLQRIRVRETVAIVARVEAGTGVGVAAQAGVYFRHE